jgi:hypothetical protein
MPRTRALKMNERDFTGMRRKEAAWSLGLFSKRWPKVSVFLKKSRLML